MGLWGLVPAENCSEPCPWPLLSASVPAAPVLSFSYFPSSLPHSFLSFFPYFLLAFYSFLPSSPKGVLLPQSIFPYHNTTPTDTDTSSCFVPLLSPHREQLHPLHRLNAQDVESFGHDGGSGFAQQQPPHVHLHDLACKTPTQELEQLLRTTNTAFPRGIPSARNLALGLGTLNSCSAQARQTDQPSCFQVPGCSQLSTQPSCSQADDDTGCATHLQSSHMDNTCSAAPSSVTTAFPAQGNTPQIACTMVCDTGTRSTPRPTLTTLPVLLNAVAVVVELGEGGGQLIKVVTERVQ